MENKKQNNKERTEQDPAPVQEKWSAEDFIKKCNEETKRNLEKYKDYDKVDREKLTKPRYS